jgi:hypothetical protein
LIRFKCCWYLLPQQLDKQMPMPSSLMLLLLLLLLLLLSCLFRPRLGLRQSLPHPPLQVLVIYDASATQLTDAHAVLTSPAAAAAAALVHLQALVGTTAALTAFTLCKCW